MDHALEFLLEHGSELSAPGVVIFFGAAFLLALWREDLVLGVSHRKCLRAVERYEREEEARTRATEAKAARLEERVDDLLDTIRALEQGKRR